MSIRLEAQWGPPMKTAATNVEILYAASGGHVEVMYHQSVDPEGFKLADFKRAEDDAYDDFRDFIEEVGVLGDPKVGPGIWALPSRSLTVAFTVQTRSNDPGTVVEAVKDLAREYGWGVGHL